MNKIFSERDVEGVVRTVLSEYHMQNKSVVQVYFPSRGMSWPYYNDRFDLKVGDLVYVEGKLEGKRGCVTEVNYSFRIKPSDYKKVIAVIDTDVEGEFYFAGSHVISFDRNTLPVEKVKGWFKAPDTEEYVTGVDSKESFPLDDLKQMDIGQEVAQRGYNYYMDNKVGYIVLDGSRGYAIVEGTESYEIEFEYVDGRIFNLNCDCFCTYTCKHEFATMLQLKEILGCIDKEYKDKFNGFFAAISKEVFINTVMTGNKPGKIVLG